MNPWTFYRYAFVQLIWTAQWVSLFPLSQRISVTKRPVLKYRLRSSTSSAWLLLGDNASQGLSLHEKVELASESESGRCHVISVAQDTIHCVTCGRIKTAKHVGLPLAMKHISGKRKSCVTSKSLWAWPVSHTNAGGWSRDGTATDWAEVLQYRKGCFCAIKHSRPGTSFVQVCWDNNDLLEETLTGIGTTHCMNGITIQRQVQLAMSQTQSVPMQPTSKGRRRRSPAIVILPEVNLEYVGWGASGSNPFSHSDLHFSSPVKY